MVGVLREERAATTVDRTLARRLYNVNTLSIK
jgi:hypothetical protein